MDDEETATHIVVMAEVKLNKIKASKESIEKKKQIKMESEAMKIKQPLINMKNGLELLSTKIDKQTVKLNEVCILAGESTCYTRHVMNELPQLIFTTVL